MTILDLTSATKKIKDTLGLGGWQLNECSYTIDNDTVTFLSVDKDLVNGSANPIDVGISPVFDALSEISTGGFSGVSFGDTKDSNDYGSTNLVNVVTGFENQIMTYDLPNSQPFMQYWGNKVTTFNISVLVANDDYLIRLRNLQEVLSKKSGRFGGKFQHPVYGEFRNTFVQKFQVVENNTAFNASLVTITFLTVVNQQPNNTNDVTLTSKLNRYIKTATDALTVISTIPTIGVQLKALFPSSFFFDSEDFGGVSDEFIQIDRESSTRVRGVTSNIKQTQPELSSAVTRFLQTGIPLDYDIQKQSNQIIEQCCLHVNIRVLGFGTGFSSTSTTSEIFTLTPEDYVNSERVLVDGTVIIETFQTTNSTIQNDGTILFTVLKDTIVEKPIVAPPNIIAMQNQIADLVVVSGVYSELDPTLNPYFATLISSLENLIIDSYQGTDIETITLEEDTLPVSLCAKYNMSFPTLIILNPELKARRKLLSGMVLTIKNNRQ